MTLKGWRLVYSLLKVSSPCSASCAIVTPRVRCCCCTKVLLEHFRAADTTCCGDNYSTVWNWYGMGFCTQRHTEVAAAEPHSLHYREVIPCYKQNYYKGIKNCAFGRPRWTGNYLQKLCIIIIEHLIGISQSWIIHYTWRVVFSDSFESLLLWKATSIKGFFWTKQLL